MRFLFSFFVLLLSFSAYTQQCQAISEGQFLPKYNQVVTQSNDSYKLNKAIVVFSGQCLKADQIKRVAMLFNQDDKKLEFCKIASHSLADYPNRYEIYDAFNSFSKVFQLHDYINSLQNNSNNPPPPPAPPTNVNFPNYVYPNPLNYQGQKGCQAVVNDQVFTSFAIQVSQKSGVDQLNHIRNNAKFYCLSMGQLMKLASLVGDKDNRLLIMKELFMNCYDLEHYPSATAVFPSATRQTEWLQYCQKELAANTACQTSNEDFQDIRKSIKEKNFTRDMMEHSRFFAQNKCLNVKQIIEIMGLFMSDNDKVDIARMFYDKCTNKDDYYKCIDALTFSMQKDELRNWLKNK